MPILNYTTTVPVEKTVSQIHGILVKAGANAIQSEYDGFGTVSAIRFRITMEGKEIFYALPANVKGVADALKRDKVFKDDKQAARVAWRIVKDWVEAQMALIDAKLAELPQVFLPYAMTNNGETVYQRIKSGGMTMLEHKS